MNTFTAELNQNFNKLSEALFNEIKGSEEVNLSLSAENTDFVRFNQAKVRQTTNVHQKILSLNFQSNNRKVKFDATFTGDLAADTSLFKGLIARARAEVDVLPEDPFIVAMENLGTSQNHHEGSPPSVESLIKDIVKSTDGSDFVGLYAGGPVIRASRNSKGQQHWFSTENFFVDFSLFTTNVDGENKAVKGNYSDSNWNAGTFSGKLQTSKNQLSLLKKRSTTLKPGEYKVYLAPGAVTEICGILSWNAMSYSAHKKGNCALSKLFEKEVQLSPKFSLRENYHLGVTPQFNSMGEMAPDQLSLIENGMMKNMLVSSRAAKEYGVPSNGADYGDFGLEPLRSPEILPGQLAEADVLKTLDTGLYLSNLHYLNWSDIMQARITGMTRYACFWVEKGEIVGPIKDMRFDNSLFSLLGSNLIDLTKEQQIDISVSTYFQRDLGGKKIPGILTDNFVFTL